MHVSWERCCSLVSQCSAGHGEAELLTGCGAVAWQIPRGPHHASSWGRISQPLGLFQIVGVSPFLSGFAFSLGVGFPLSGTGALFAFPYAFFSGPGEQRFSNGWFCLCITC